MAEGMGHRGRPRKLYQIARRVKVDSGTCESDHAVGEPVAFAIRDMPDQALSAKVGGTRTGGAGFSCWACLARFNASLMRLIR